MDNNPSPKFDPETGRPLTPPPAQDAQPKFDPETGRPLTPPPAQDAQPKFDPETGRPLTPPPAQPVMQYDPQTGRTLQTLPPAEKQPANAAAIISLVCGILSILCCCCGWLSPLLGIVAIILALVSRKGGKMSGLAIGGLICGIAGALFGLVIIIASFAMSAGTESMVESILNSPEFQDAFGSEFEFYY